MSHSVVVISAFESLRLLIPKYPTHTQTPARPRRKGRPRGRVGAVLALRAGRHSPHPAHPARTPSSRLVCPHSCGEAMHQAFSSMQRRRAACDSTIASPPKLNVRQRHPSCSRQATLALRNHRPSRTSHLFVCDSSIHAQPARYPPPAAKLNAAALQGHLQDKPSARASASATAHVR